VPIGDGMTLNSSQDENYSFSGDVIIYFPSL